MQTLTTLTAPPERLLLVPSVESGLAELTRPVRDLLHAQALPPESAHLRIVLDAPWGYALDVLQTDATNAVVITRSPVREYLEDLWECGPAVLIAHPDSDPDLIDVLRRASVGDRWRDTPPGRPVLTPAERAVLRYVARGLSNKQIARRLDVIEGTVQNALSKIFQKLRVANRTQAALYYWGRLPRA
ncbi:response regulator transcription factor [Deinococcus maricopensis]|uniref:Transcriptional regulator, LuxR family n=1 Tax=Deinococcus maricopensis (strain DSM 21211 / LMG 22137 / NRRL B-23946 / LB-34) TaxID=709986 RepID=E8U6E6_DEIML|nr:response regulator transcription factor [Deinococcus maricopensis]ADV66635.1 transcriptional regulator, LuxR family [Deinococcus maricopensis DSM 21211]